MKLKVLELFAGTRSAGKAFEEAGHEVFSIDWDRQFQNIDMFADIGELTAATILEVFGQPDIIFASPDCTTYSIAGISHHRTREATGNLAPKSDYAKICDKVNLNVMKLIEELKPKLFFIENPMGGFRKMYFIQGINRFTVTYCQYEMDKEPNERRMKPTDFFTNHNQPNFRTACKNGMPCHVRAQRGARTGTQGIKGKINRAIIPDELCKHIVEISEEYCKGLLL